MSDLFKTRRGVNYSCGAKKKTISLNNLSLQLRQLENEINHLKNENERLNIRLLEQFELYLKAIEVYQKALKKCSPYMLISHPEAQCYFCKNTTEHSEPHTNNCEYMNLIGGNDNGC